MKRSIYRSRVLSCFFMPEGDMTGGGSGAPSGDAGDAGAETNPENDSEDSGDDLYGDPEKARAYAAKLRKEAASTRAKLRDAEQKVKDAEDRNAAMRKAAGLEPESTPEGDALEQIKAGVQAERDQLSRERYILRNAARFGLNADALVDSRTFTDGIMGLDPKDFTALDAKMESVKNNPAYRARSAGPSTPDVPAGGKSEDFNNPALRGTPRLAQAYAEKTKR